MAVEGPLEGGIRLSDSTVLDQHINSAAAIQRSKLQQDVLKPYPILSTYWRVWDNLAALLPATSSSDDLGLYPGTWGTTPWMIRSSDLKAAGSTTLKAACEVCLPAEYDDGQTVTVRFRAGMITTVADTACTVDVAVYEKAGTGASVGSDLSTTTAATSINSLTFTNKDFVITPTALAAGDVLQILITMVVNDAATVSAVIGAIEQVSLLLDVKG